MNECTVYENHEVYPTRFLCISYLIKIVASKLSKVNCNQPK